MPQPETHSRQERRAERGLTILETCEYKTSPGDSSATLLSKIMIAEAGRNAVKISDQLCPIARSGARQ